MKTILLALLFIFPIMLLCQSIYLPEEKDDDYLPMRSVDKNFSPTHDYKTSRITTVQVNTTMSGMNILNDAANEPTIAINPLNSDEIVIAWRQFDNIESNFRQAGLAFSRNGGVSWTNVGPIESGIFRSDPVLDVNSSGRFFFNSLKQDFSCDVFSTSDLTDWSFKTDAFGGDKQWMVVDKTETNSNGNIYAFWTEIFSTCFGDFTMSNDSGVTFESCLSVDSNPRWGTMSIDTDGVLYACGTGSNGSIVVLRSDSARNLSSDLNWESSTNVNFKGRQAFGGPNPGGLLGQLWIGTDNSEIESKGNVYLLSSIKRDDNSDPADVMFSSSIDKGRSWSEAMVVNDDNSENNWQWFGTMSVAPNGRLDAIWLDTRDNPGTYLSSLYYSNSIDGGIKWSHNIRLSQEFDPHLGWPNQNKIGDYFHMTSTNENAYLAWSATFNGEQDVYFSKINPIGPATSLVNINDSESFKIYPNPFDSHLYFDNSIIGEAITDISVYDIRGSKILSKNIPGGNFSDKIFLSNNIGDHLSCGVYFVKVSFADKAPQIVRVIKN